MRCWRVFRMAVCALPRGAGGESGHRPGFWCGAAVLSLSGYPVLKALLTISCVLRTTYILGGGQWLASLWVEHGKGS